jgi:integrase
MGKHSSNVSDVHLDVSRDVSRTGAADPAPLRSRKRAAKQRSAGRYLVRAGAAFLFQLRVPTVLVLRGFPPLVRLSIGPVTHLEARRIADFLAVNARMKMRELIDRPMTTVTDEQTDDGHLAIEANGEAYDSAEAEVQRRIKQAEIKTYLNTCLMMIRGSAALHAAHPIIIPEQEAFGQIIEVNRQLDARQAGNPHLTVVTENAGVLKGLAICNMERSLGLDDADSTEPVVVSAVESGRGLSAFPSVAEPTPKKPTGQPEVNVTDDFSTASMSLSLEDSWLDHDGDDVGYNDPADEDRKNVPRGSSTRPFFSVVARDYLRGRAEAKSKGKLKDIQTAEGRIKLFIELIGDHPVDTYTARDLQAYVNKLRYWPSDPKRRPSQLPAEAVIESNRDLRFKPLAKATLQDGYLAVIKPVFGRAATRFEFINPMIGVRLNYPDTAKASRPVEPLGAAKISAIFKTGIESGYLDLALLPLLGHLTGRRLGLLIYLRGSDIREKYEGVWVANTAGVIFGDGSWQRIGYKTDASLSFYVLHDILREVGFIQWAQAQGDRFLFPELMRLVRPANSASSYMQRLFQRAGIKPGNREVFHSLRSNKIAELQDNHEIDGKTARLQAGHSLGDDEHTLYGWRYLSEPRARQLATLALDPAIDFAQFKGLDYKSLAAAKRRNGKRWPTA